MMLGYKSNNHVVYSCKYHVIWCPKYRRKVLVGDIAKRLEEIMRKTALKYRAEISALEIVPDQVHLLGEVDPRFGIHRFVKRIKGVTSHVFQKRIRQPPKAPAKSVDEFVLGLEPWAVHRSKSFSSTWRIKRMSDEYITPTALGAERNCSGSKVALQPDKTLRIAGSGGQSGSLLAMSRVIAIEQEYKPCKSENRRRASLSVAQTKYAEMIEWVQSLEIKFFRLANNHPQQSC